MSWRHIDLFSGAISGFSFAASQVWPNCEHVALCEIDPWRRKQLNRLWPGVRLIEDIRDIDSIVNVCLPFGHRTGNSRVTEHHHDGTDTRKPKELRQGGKQIVMQGYPCSQRRLPASNGPLSCAGKRKGEADSRWLWPETINAIEILRPANVILENPTGLISFNNGMAYEGICLELENQGYEVQTYIIPASAVGAWHRRDRVWIIAHVESEHVRRCDGTKGGGQIPEPGVGVGAKVVTDANQVHGDIPGHGASEICGERRQEAGICGRPAADPDQSGPQIREVLERNLRTQFQAPIRDSWTDHWISAIRALCSVVHVGGRPRKGGGIEADRTRWIAALGDSIVPQVPMQIMQAIKQAENTPDGSVWAKLEVFGISE